MRGRFVFTERWLFYFFLWRYVPFDECLPDSWGSHAIATNVWLPDAVADLATEFSPLAQNENSKKERTIYRKIAIAFDSG